MQRLMVFFRNTFVKIANFKMLNYLFTKKNLHAKENDGDKLCRLVFLRFPLHYRELFVSLREAHVHMHGVANFKGEHAVFG